MVAVLSPALPALAATANDGEHWDLLQDDPAFAATSDPELERWIGIACRQANVPCAALSLMAGSRQIVRVVGVAAGSPEPVTELPSTASLERYLLGPVTEADTGGAFAEAPVLVAGKIVGQLAIARPTGKTWSPEDLSVLAETAAGVSTELERRLARTQVVRVQQLVTAHNRVHDMIGRSAPLRDVLVEVCRIIERYDPSFIPSVLLRDPVSNTLHSGVGPSLPKEYLDGIEGAPISPSIGTCGPAAWFGELAISDDLSLDPNWAAICHMAVSAGVAHCWSMPIKDMAGEVLGTLALYGR